MSVAGGGYYKRAAPTKSQINVEQIYKPWAYDPHKQWRKLANFSVDVVTIFANNFKLKNIARK